MSFRRLAPLFAAVLLLSVNVVADPQAAPKPVGEPMSRETRLLVIRSLNAEFVFVRRPLPQGQKAITIKDGHIVAPTEDEIARSLATYGPAAKPGDRAQITNVLIKSDKIICEINGGPKKKTKWYQHISVSGMGTATTTQPAPDAATKNPHGMLVELDFDRFVPDMTGDQVRELLSPIFDFKAKSAAEAYVDTVPPKVKEAIKNHQVLVGMNREMVNYAKGRPERKIREKDSSGKEYEEWLYGQPPQEVEFVRFEGDEVVRLEIMKVDGEKVVRTEKEVDLPQPVAEKQSEPKPASAPAKRPSLRRPGEEPDNPEAPGTVPQTVPANPAPDTQSPSQPIVNLAPSR